MNGPAPEEAASRRPPRADATTALRNLATDNRATRYHTPLERLQHAQLAHGEGDGVDGDEERRVGPLLADWSLIGALCDEVC